MDNVIIICCILLGVIDFEGWVILICFLFLATVVVVVILGDG